MADSSVKRFAYTARNAQGELVSGSITSDSEATAARRLQAMGLAPLSLRRSTGSSGSSSANPLTQFKEWRKSRPQKFKAKDIAIFARQFATMVEAGLPLVRTINAIVDQSDHNELKRVLPSVRNDIEAGQSLSYAMSKFPGVFPPLMVGMITAGEISGSLGNAMNMVADNYDKDAKLRGKVVNALTYPVIVMGLATVMVSFMLIFIVPKFAEVFHSLDAELPWPTQALITISQWAVFVIPILVLAGIIFGVWWRQNKNERKVREVVDPLKLKIPIVGKFMQKVSLARFARTFSSLLTAGVPMIQALEITAATSGSIVISDALGDVRNSVRAGKPVHTTMEQHDIFPPLLNNMISTGEETGALSPMLTRVAEFYERDVDESSERLGVSLEPILLIIMAVIVGGMIIALYLPIFSIYEHIGVKK
jgi:type IV pilus assembly protein PilC